VSGADAPAALLFDLGGVLLEVDLERSFAAWAASAGVPVARIAERFAVDAAYEAFERGEIGESEYAEALGRRLGVALAPEAFAAGWNAMLVGPRRGAVELVRALAARWPLYLFSNTNRPHKNAWLTRHAALLEPFSALYCSCDIGLRKPRAAAFREVCRRVGEPPERIAFFDDLEENVGGAARAGLRAYHVPAGSDTAEVVASALGVRDASGRIFA